MKNQRLTSVTEDDGCSDKLSYLFFPIDHVEDDDEEYLEPNLIAKVMRSC